MIIDPGTAHWVGYYDNDGTWRVGLKSDIDPNGGGSGLPPQWTADNAHGDVVATVDDPTKTALTIRAVASQVAALLSLKDENGNPIFTVDPVTGALAGVGGTFFESAVPAANQLERFDGGSGPIVADAGNYTIDGHLVDGTHVVIGPITVGDNEATVQAAFDVQYGAGTTTITGDWSSFTCEYVGTFAELTLPALAWSTNDLTLGGNPVDNPVDHLLTTGTPGYIQYPDWRYTTAGGTYGPGLPTLYPNTSDRFDDAGWIMLDPFGPRIFLSLGPLTGGAPLSAVELNAARNSASVIAIGASDDDSQFIEAVTEADVAPGGGSRQGTFGLDGDLAGHARFTADDDGFRLVVKANAGQTGMLADLQDSTGASKGRVTPNGTPIFNAHAAPADGDLNNSDHATWLDDTPGATVFHIKAKDSAGTVRTGQIALT